MDKNLLSVLMVLGAAAGLIYVGQKKEEKAAPEEPEDNSLPTSLDAEDEALQEALKEVE